MKPEKDNTFCHFPFYQLALKKWNADGIGNAAPCCNAIRPEHPDPLNVNNKLMETDPTPEDIFYGPEMEELRQSLLRGEKHPACATCWKIESGGSNESYRMHSKPIHESAKQDNLIEEPKLQSIDLIVGEHCNLRCRMCGPGLSNSLRKDYKLFVDKDISTEFIPGFEWKQHQEEYNNKTQDDDVPQEDINNTEWNKNYKDEKGHIKSWNWVNEDNRQWQSVIDNIHNIRHIKATGGETTITKSWVEFVDYAIQSGASKNMVLEFHTNATKFTDALVKKFSYFEKVHINLSIDSIEKNYEYLRYPMTWEGLTRSLNNLYLKSSDLGVTNLGTSFNPVISILNVGLLPNIIEYWKQNIKYKYTNFNASFFADTVYPDQRGISIRHLSPKIKKRLLKDYTVLQGNNRTVTLQSVLSALARWQDYEPSDQELLRLYNEVNAFDIIRNQSYRDYCDEEIVSYIDSIYERLVKGKIK